MNLMKLIPLALIISTTAVAIESDPRLQDVLAADSADFPSAQAITDKMGQLRPEVDKAMAVAPSDANDLSRIVAEKPVVNLPPNPKGFDPEKNKFDLNRMIADYERIQSGDLTPANKPYEFIVLLSFSMPEPVLRAYLEQAASYKATVVFRGTPTGDLQLYKTQERVVALKPKAMPRVDINPNAFKKYDIKRVPSIVLSKTQSGQKLDENGCAPAGDYLAVTGEVSIPYALTLFKKSKNETLLTAVNDVLMTARARP